MGTIVTPLSARHDEAQALLPWLVSGRLEGEERARVEAHVSDCRQCRLDFAAERRLMVEWSTLPMDRETSWLRLRANVERDTRPRAGVVSKFVKRSMASARASLPVLGWLIAGAQACTIAVVFLTPRPPQTVATYHALGGVRAPAEGNLLVMFSPNTREDRIRDMLSANQARLIDGPTPAGAYLLWVPAKDRAAALRNLRGRPEIELAQPVDSSLGR